MNEIENIFVPIIGHHVWFVHRRLGTLSSLEMEFGQPHLHVRNPHIAKIDLPEDATKRLARRKVCARGQWHFETIFADWTATAEGATYSRSDSLNGENDVLGIISGQKLTTVNFEVDKKILILEFDFGGIVRIYPPTHIENEDAALWHLHTHNGEKIQGDNISLRHNGILMTCSDHSEPVFTKV